MQAMAMNAVSALPIASAPEVSRVALADLKVDRCFRESGVSKEHVELLAELDGRWPPVLVRHADHLVVDGIHRVTAARLLGLRWIEVEWFDGDADDALLEFVRRQREPRLAAHVAASAERRRISPVVYARGLVGSATRRTLRDLTEDGGDSAHQGRRSSKWAKSSLGQGVAGRARRSRSAGEPGCDAIAGGRSDQGAAGRVATQGRSGCRCLAGNGAAGAHEHARGARRRVVAPRWSARGARRLQGRRSGGVTPRWCRATRATSSPGSTGRRSPSRSVRRGPRRSPSGGCTRSPTRPVAGPSCG